ncbi:NADH-quinone oxidoreductase subunit J family protein [Chondromyces apiculatus]|uniref:NADH-quinone oxidoreductase subunit J n=1 Tax=Chondromyces apiculatus DSM 436 TaxID=1192034 RepID=A0A017T1R9_9BACT|nr:NADH-quinone oxidoreductase subunit J [Chondromyces apiculatus]EYF02795.1 NADH-ubiquinone oxidoreductase chain J [Chondromyces apiculatus DSM 436]
MKIFELAFFFLASLLVVLGGFFTVASRNPIRGAMGLLSAIVGIAGLYLMLAAEFLAAIQILVYAGAVVVLFLFVIMLLGPSATSGRDTRSALPRYLGAGVLLAASVGALVLVFSASAGPRALSAAPTGMGTVEGFGRELFTQAVVPFEIAGVLLLIAVVGAVAVARGKQVDPTLAPAPGDDDKQGSDAARAVLTTHTKDVHS